MLIQIYDYKTHASLFFKLKNSVKRIKLLNLLSLNYKFLFYILSADFLKNPNAELKVLIFYMINYNLFQFIVQFF